MTRPKQYTPRKAGDPTYQEYRMRYIPRQIVAARHKLRALENEARRYGMLHLLEPAE